MKLISLNIWQGEIYQPLVDFLKKYRTETDIFCFQEVFKSEDGVRNLSPEKTVTFNNLKDILGGFDGYFEDYVAPGEYNKEGLAVFLKKGIKAEDKGEVFIYNPPKLGISDNNPHSLWRNLQYVKCNSGDREFFIANLHGLFDFSNKSHKNDTPERIEQSQRV